MDRITAEIIERRRNVVIDHKTEMYSHGTREDEYGWMPIPDEWILRLEADIQQPEETTCKHLPVARHGKRLLVMKPL